MIDLLSGQTSNTTPILAIPRHCTPNVEANGKKSMLVVAKHTTSRRIEESTRRNEDSSSRRNDESSRRSVEPSRRNEEPNRRNEEPSRRNEESSRRSEEPNRAKNDSPAMVFIIDDFIHKNLIR